MRMLPLVTIIISVILYLNGCGSSDKVYDSGHAVQAHDDTEEDHGYVQTIRAEGFDSKESKTDYVNTAEMEGVVVGEPTTDNDGQQMVPFNLKIQIAFKEANDKRRKEDDGKDWREYIPEKLEAKTDSNDLPVGQKITVVRTQVKKTDTRGRTEWIQKFRVK